MSPALLSAPWTTGALVRRCFECMGTSMELLVDTPACEETNAALDAAEAELHRLDRMLSRFRPDSELSALNRAGQALVSPELFELTELALAAREQTAGRFDPTVHDAIVAAGYYRTFVDLPADARDHQAVAPPRCGGAVHLEPARRLVRLERGARLDFGGIAKGYAAERACDLLAAAGPCLVNAGGDIAVRGLLQGEPWPVGIETLGEPITLAVEKGGVATTGRDRRRWRRNGDERHHVIDPATGASASVDLLRVTVVAGTAVEAEVTATALFLVGKTHAVTEADVLGIPCVLVTTDELVLAGGLER